MTYNVFGGMLSLTQSITIDLKWYLQSWILGVWQLALVCFICPRCLSWRVKICRTLNLSLWITAQSVSSQLL